MRKTVIEEVKQCLNSAAETLSIDELEVIVGLQLKAIRGDVMVLTCFECKAPLTLLSMVRVGFAHCFCDVCGSASVVYQGSVRTSRKSTSGADESISIRLIDIDGKERHVGLRGATWWSELKSRDLVSIHILASRYEPADNWNCVLVNETLGG